MFHKCTAQNLRFHKHAKKAWPGDFADFWDQCADCRILIRLTIWEVVKLRAEIRDPASKGDGINMVGWLKILEWCTRCRNCTVLPRGPLQDVGLAEP